MTKIPTNTLRAAQGSDPRGAARIPTLGFPAALGLLALATLLALSAPAGAQDADADGVPDAADNCRLAANPRQLDGDADGFGNACDADLDQDLTTAASDFFTGFRPCLGSAVATSPGCAAADFDGDGLVSASDYFGFFRPLLGSAPGPGAAPGGDPVVVGFADVRSRVEEGGTIEVPILLDRPGAASLSFRVSGSAAAGDVVVGASCQPLGADLECTLQASQTTTLLQIRAVDDRDPDGAPEPAERLSIQLHAGPGVELGALAQHVVIVENNDAVWEGIFSAEGEEIGFSLEIQRQGDQATATLVSDGVGALPAGRTPLGAIEFDLEAERFDVVLPEVVLGGGERVLRSEARLGLSLEASAATGLVSTTRVEGHRDRGSSSNARFVFPSAPHLDRSVPGSFVLTRRATAVSE